MALLTITTAIQPHRGCLCRHLVYSKTNNKFIDETVNTALKLRILEAAELVVS
jgi:hypothetical protein